MTFSVRRLFIAALCFALAASSSLFVGRSAHATGSRARVVVAVIDTGINPYHEFFHRGGPVYGLDKPSSVTPAVLREFGIDKDHIVNLTRTGNFAADFGKDARQFDRMKRGELYWFKGTNIMGISFTERKPLRPDGKGENHGIGTAAAVIRANPEAIVIAVEGMANTEAEKWAFTEPGVDIVSTSYGPFTSYPTLNHLSNSYEGVVERGKAHFGAAANDPTWSSLDETSGPWWSIGIGGLEEADGEKGGSSGRQLWSGNVPDFVGDFTQELPYCRNCEEGMREVGGTSFATPRSAGTFSKILLDARRAVGHPGGIVRRAGKSFLVAGGDVSMTVWDIRRALEEAAYYPGLADYSPEPDGSVPVNDQGPWFQTGWGLISPDRKYDVIERALASLGIRGKATADKPQQACDFMTANMAARHAYWDRAALMGDGYGKSEDPYIYC